MATCTFFGHRDCLDSVLPSLKTAVFDLIEKQGVDCFYIGNHGNYDWLALRVLREAKTSYPHISTLWCLLICRVRTAQHGWLPMKHFSQRG